MARPRSGSSRTSTGVRSLIVSPGKTSHSELLSGGTLVLDSSVLASGLEPLVTVGSACASVVSGPELLHESTEAALVSVRPSTNNMVFNDITIEPPWV